MLIQNEDFNNVSLKIDKKYKNHWTEIEYIIENMPLHVKASDQAGMKGEPIFDAVGTNAYLKEALTENSWQANIPIPEKYRFLGTDVDFGKGEVIVEVQFANYPFLLNNLLRSELLYKAQVTLADELPKVLVIVTKGRMFPASNSTLYFEQAVRQVSALAENAVFEMPIRIVGLFESEESIVNAVWTEYENPRYSRIAVTREKTKLRVLSSRSGKGRCQLAFV